MRYLCIVCDSKYNLEELAECIKCKYNVCQECVIFDEGYYYCPKCFDEK